MYTVFCHEKCVNRSFNIQKQTKFDYNAHAYKRCVLKVYTSVNY